MLMAACGQRFTAGQAMPESGGGSGGGGSASAQSSGDEAGAQSVGAGAGAAGDAGDAGNSATTGGSGQNGGAGGEQVMSGAGSGDGTVFGEPPIPQDGLELWFDAEVGVTQVAGAVGAWEDRSPNRRDALQTAVNYRPKLSREALSGKSGIVFDGVDDYLKLPALPGDFSRGLSLFVVNQSSSAPEVCDTIFQASRGSEIADIHIGAYQGALLYEVFQDLVHATERPLEPGLPQLLAVVHAPSGQAQLRRNSSGLAEGSAALPETIERDSVFIGHGLYADCPYFGGAISELLVYSRSVTDLELVRIESYLQTKWGCCAD